MKRLFAWVRDPRVWGVYAILLVASFIYQQMRPLHPVTTTGLHVQQVHKLTASGKQKRSSVGLAYRELGTGEPIILLHGSPGDHTAFDRLAPLLAKRYRVIIPDLPGFGASSAWLPDYSSRAHARYVLALMDELQIHDASVLGFSMGSGVAYNMVDLAPDRVRTLTVYGGVGIVEGEGSGDHFLERCKYTLGFIGLVVVPEFIPHFGLLGERRQRYAFIRNFWDSDLRPMRGIISRVDCPMLIIQGRQDPLVYAWVAEEHHRLVDKSELVIFDDDHFMLFDDEKTDALYKVIAPFLRSHVIDGDPAIRRTLDFSHAVDTGDQLPVDINVNPVSMSGFSQIGIVILSTFVTEDLTCITVGMLVRDLKLDWFVGLIGCVIGIFIGDVSLWAVGRFAGRLVMRLPFTKRWFPDNSMDLIQAWFDRYGMSAVFISRFIPGTRIPTFVGAGMLGRGMHRFMLWAFLANAIWTPMLILLAYLFGSVVATPFRHLFGHGWISLLASLAVVVIFLKLTLPLFTEEGRLREKAKLAKIWRWEFWPAWLFYLPLVPWLAWLSVRYRGITTFTAANPGIPDGGVVGESKSDILTHLPSTWIMPSALLAANAVADPQATHDPDADATETAREQHPDAPADSTPSEAAPAGPDDTARLPDPGATVVDTGDPLPTTATVILPDDASAPRVAALRAMLHQLSWQYPLVFKPNASQRGAGVKIIRDAAAAVAYLRAMPVDILIQPYHPGPWEAGIFYYRFPGEERGHIFSITDKQFAEIRGDGTTPLKRLILQHPRYRMQADIFLRRHHAEIELIPAAGERVTLGRVGNHCQGTLFRDGADLITPELEATIDRIAHEFDGFHIGRFDVRYSDPEAFKLGKDMAILELNGVTSESTNIYDPRWSLCQAYRTLYRQWALLYQIGDANRRLGKPTTSIRRLLREVCVFYRSPKIAIISD